MYRAKAGTLRDNVGLVAVRSVLAAARCIEAMAPLEVGRVGCFVADHDPVSAIRKLGLVAELAEGRRAPMLHPTLRH